jgi:hypothetical protein
MTIFFKNIDASLACYFLFSLVCQCITEQQHPTRSLLHAKILSLSLSLSLSSPSYLTGYVP